LSSSSDLVTNLTDNVENSDGTSNFPSIDDYQQQLTELKEQGSVYIISADDPTTITGITDWQSSSIEPALMYADEMPDFAAPNSLVFIRRSARGSQC
jgi:hypothetical protein